MTYIAEWRAYRAKKRTSKIKALISAAKEVFLRTPDDEFDRRLGRLKFFIY